MRKGHQRFKECCCPRHNGCGALRLLTGGSLPAAGTVGEADGLVSPEGAKSYVATCILSGLAAVELAMGTRVFVPVAFVPDGSA